MTLAQKYISKIESLPTSASEDDKATLVKDTVSVFSERIPGIEKGLDCYKARAIGVNTVVRYDNDGDLRKLLDKLWLRREDEAREAATNPVLGATAKLDADIIRCEEMLLRGDADSCDELVDRLVLVYQSELPSIGLSLTTYDGTDESGYDHFEDLSIVKERLETYRARIISSFASPQGGATHLTVNNSAEASSDVRVALNVSQVSSQVQTLPDNILDDEEKDALRLMLLDLEEAKGKPKEEAHPQIKKILSWLSDKGVDVALAVLPYIISCMQTLV